MALQLRKFVQEQDAVVRPRHLPRPQPLPPADPADNRDRVVWGATRPGGDTGGLAACQAGDAVDAGGVEGFGQAHRRQDGDEAAGQPRLPHPRWRQEEVMVSTPAYALP
jgi:hypothetical protein